MDIPDKLAPLISRANSQGVETSFNELILLAGYEAKGSLQAVSDLLGIVDVMNLEFSPSPTVGELTTKRILRSSVRNSAESRVTDLLRQGESQRLEFKSSMFCDMKKFKYAGKLEMLDVLEDEPLRAICAFLNGEGGDLLVGVSDDGASCKGINLDLQLKGWNEDRWYLHFQDIVASRFFQGEQIRHYIRTELVRLNEDLVFHVSVTPKVERSFVKIKHLGDKYQFFVRNGPQTINLDIVEFYTHMQVNGVREQFSLGML